MKTHYLKTLPEFFSAINDGSKTFEARKDDRGFEVGDHATLEEYTLKDGYTGRRIYTVITYILRGGQYGIEEGYCVFGIEIIPF